MDVGSLDRGQLDGGVAGGAAERDPVQVDSVLGHPGPPGDEGGVPCSIHKVVVVCNHIAALRGAPLLGTQLPWAELADGVVVSHLGWWR